MGTCFIQAAGVSYLCGIRDSIGQKLLDPLSFAGCSVYVSQDGKRANHQCKLVGKISYSTKSAAKSSYSTRPCTNQPPRHVSQRWLWRCHPVVFHGRALPFEASGHTHEP